MCYIPNSDWSWCRKNIKSLNESNIDYHLKQSQSCLQDYNKNEGNFENKWQLHWSEFDLDYEWIQEVNGDADKMQISKKGKKDKSFDLLNIIIYKIFLTN